MRLWVGLLVWLAMFPAFGATVLCEASRMGLKLPVQALEDAERTLTPLQVAALPDAQFVGDIRPSEIYSHSAYWLRFVLHNNGDALCSRWLSIGEPRLDNVQVHLLRDGRWSEMLSGSDYPLADWALRAREPLFPLMLAPDEEVQVIIRIASRGVLMPNPRLWTEAEQLRVSQSAHLLDGIALGIGILIVPFSLIVGFLIRSRLLMVHALAILSYLLLVCSATGYLFYVPGLLPWVHQIVGALSGFALLFFMAYVGVLFRVPQLPKVWRYTWLFAMVSLSGLLLWGAIGDFMYTRILFAQLRWVLYLIVPLFCVLAWRRGLQPSWLAWLLVGMFSLQGMSRYLLGIKDSVWQYGEDPLSLPSSLPGIFLLVCTLVMEFRRNWRNEQLARAELDEQRVAEQDRLETTVARRTEQLQEVLRARSSLLARISHDLRSPLAGIIEYSHQLQGRDNQDYPQRIERNARRQLEMIDELLEFSRSELQQQELVVVPGYLYRFLREIEDEGRFLAQRQNNQFECLIDAGLPPLVHADFRRLRRVLVNLLGNAAKFTRDGLVELHISTVSRDEGRVSLHVEVCDSGIGIHADESEQVLQPFSRGRNAVRYEGAGLGLSIVSQLLEQMGSTLQVDTEQVSGTRFHFQLDLATAHENELDLVLLEGRAVALSGDGSRLLLVDDVEQNRESMADLLAGYGFEVMVAASGEEAVSLLAEQRFDALITDQMMAGFDGWQLLAWVREHKPELPVLLYSAAPPLRPSHVAAELVFDAALLKPADGGELIEQIARLLEHRLEAGGAI